MHHDYALLLSNGFKQYNEASTHYLKAIEYATDDNVKKGNYCGNYAGLLRTMKQYENSEVFFQRALEINPNDIHHLSNYADLLREIGKYKESKVKFNRAVSIIEVSEMNQNKKKRVSIKKKRSSNKQRKSDLIHSSHSDHPNNKKKKSSIYKRGSFVDTKTTKLAIQESNNFTKKNVSITYSNYGLLLFSMKAYDESSKLYIKSIEMDDTSPIRHYNYARLLYDTQAWNLAMNHLEIALELSSNEHAASYWLYGRILMELNEFDKGSLYLKNAVNLQRSNPLFRCDYILCLIEFKMYEEAVNEMQNYKKLKLHYTYFDLVYTYFIAKVRGQREDAIKNFKILMSAIPDDHPTSINSKFIYCYYYAWFCQYILMNYKEANKYYEIIVDKLRPKHALSAYHYAVSIVSKWIHQNNKKKSNVQEIDLNDDDKEEEMSEYGDEQVKEYKHALRLLQKAYALNDCIPIIRDHYQALLGKIQSVIGDEAEEKSKSNLDSPKSGNVPAFTIRVSSMSIADDEQKMNL